jgi:AraC family transcriptional regulator
MGYIINIKNMVCNRCIKVVDEEISKLGFEIKSIELGKVVLSRIPNDTEKEEIEASLLNNGFELIDDKESKIIETIKTIVIEMVHHGKEKNIHINTSDVIANEVGMDYSYLSNLFSAVEGTTIEKFVISQKIERAKELLVYNEISLNEISYDLGYSSVQHLSNQFKKVTGLSPSHFKKIKKNKRRPLDKI